jgi:hypothetical protein
MILRYLIALVGALAITIGLFMFMDDIANRYVLRDPIRYFQIMDVIPAPDRGRQRVPAPADPRLAPEVPRLEMDDEPSGERPVTDPIGPDVSIEPEITRSPVFPESA